MSQNKLAEGDVLYARALVEYDRFPTSQEKLAAIEKFLVEKSNETKHNTMLLHSRMRLYMEMDNKAARRFVLGLENQEFLIESVRLAGESLLVDRQAIRTIEARWPDWSWDIFGAHRPEVWSTRILKSLRWLACRYTNFRLVRDLLIAVIDDRIHRREGRQGVSKSPALQACDLRTVIRNSQENGALSLGAEVTDSSVVDSTAGSIENGVGLGREKDIEDMSTFILELQAETKTGGGGEGEGDEEEEGGGEEEGEREQYAEEEDGEQNLPPRKRRRRPPVAPLTTLDHVNALATSLERDEKAALDAIIDAPVTATPENAENVRVLVKKYNHICRDRQAFLAFRGSSSYHI
jgi:hypothetical protein